MKPSLTDAVARLGTEGAFAVLARARALEAEGRDIIHLEIGEPDFETPPHVAEAGIAAIRAGETHYCQTAGLPVLREAAAASLAASRAVAIDPQRVLVANGAKPFLFFTVLATCGPGDEVVYPDPGFPIYESAVRFAGAVPVPLPLREDRRFSFDPDELEQLVNERTRLVILNAPQNPTGGVIPSPTWNGRQRRSCEPLPGSSRTRCTRGSPTTSRRRRLRRFRACSTARSSWTASRRRSP